MGLIVLYLLLLFRALRRNAARKALRPIVRRLASTHPQRLARRGDNGWGIDNTSPWYHLYLIVDLTPDPENVVTSAAREAGYELHVDQRLINGMLGLPGPGGNNATFRGQFNPTSSYLIAKNGDRTLKASITRDGEVKIYASQRNITYGQAVRPPAGKAIVSLCLSLPDIR